MRRRPFATVLVEPSALLREGLSRILAAADFRIIASVSHLDDAVLSSLLQQQSLLLIIDSDSEDCEETVAQIRVFREQHASGHVAVLADQYRLGSVVAAFRAGANAYFVKGTTCDAFIKALELVMLGETILPLAVLPLIPDYENEDEDEPIGRAVETSAEELLDPGGHQTPRLSSREKCILRCLIDGDSNKTIARKIAIAEATVKVHVKAILRKVRVNNRTQAAIWALNNGPLLWAADNHAPKAPARPLTSSTVVPFVGPTLPPTVARHVKGANDVVLPSVEGLIQRAIAHKHD